MSTHNYYVGYENERNFFVNNILADYGILKNIVMYKKKFLVHHK